MSFKGKLRKYEDKLRVYQYYVDGSFDSRDKKRLKPLTRLRKDEKEIDRANSGSITQRVKDWYKDIDKEHPKK